MTNNYFDIDKDLYLKVFVKAIHGARSTLRTTMPDYAAKITELIEMPRDNYDQVCLFLLSAHHVVLNGRDEVYESDEEASSLFDAIHNIPYGLLGRFEGGWDWKKDLPSIFKEHENCFLSGLKKYSGLFQNGF